MDEDPKHLRQRADWCQRMARQTADFWSARILRKQACALIARANRVQAAAPNTTLAQIHEHFPRLDVACNRCCRHELVSTYRLVELGPAMRMPELRQIVAGDCPRMVAGQQDDPCGVYFPFLQPPPVGFS